MRRLHNYLNKPYRLEYTAIILLIGLAVLTAVFGKDNDKKYTIYSQGETYCVDNFRVMGGQLLFDAYGKSILIKGNYIIEINKAK